MKQLYSAGKSPSPYTHIPPGSSYTLPLPSKEKKKKKKSVAISADANVAVKITSTFSYQENEEMLETKKMQECFFTPKVGGWW